MNEGTRTDSPENAASTKRRKLRLLWIVLLSPVAVLLLMLIAGSWHYVRTSQQIGAELKRIAAAGEPLTVEDIEAAYALPSGVSDPTPDWLPLLEQETIYHWDREYRSLPLVGTPDAILPIRGEAWPDEPEVAAFLDRREDKFERLRSLVGTACHVRFPLILDWEMRSTQAVHVLKLAEVMRLRAHWLAFHGKNAEALETLLLIRGMSESIANEPHTLAQSLRRSIDEQMLRATLDLLPHADWSDAQLEQLQSELSNPRDYLGDTRGAIVSERVSNNLAFDEPETFDLLQPPEYDWLRPADRLFYLRTYARLISASKLPLSRAIAECKAIDDNVDSESEWMKWRHTMTHKVLSNVSVDLRSCGEIMSRERATLTLIACQRYALRHGTYPKRLDELVPAFMSELPSDPFGGERMRYLPGKADIAVYGIGQDLIDDGGTRKKIG